MPDYNPHVTDKPFGGKVALVTGASRTIGRAIALRLGAMGAAVFVNYSRREEDALEVVAELEALGSRGWAVRADVGDLDQVHAMFETVAAEAGGLDFLVNSAARGLQRPRSAMASLPNHLRNTFDINVLGPWFATKAAAPLMKPRGGGAIVNITSLGAQRYMPNYAAVGVTKGALDTLTRYLAVELAPHGIRVNGVCPSWVEETGGVTALPNAYGEAIRAATPIGRAVSPEDVADAVAFLCGPGSAMIVGQNIVIDGGLTLLGIITPAE
jgi:enoyl-[acyl-carrier protein] reductase III